LIQKQLAKKLSVNYVTIFRLKTSGYEPNKNQKNLVCLYAGVDMKR